MFAHTTPNHCTSSLPFLEIVFVQDKVGSVVQITLGPTLNKQGTNAPVRYREGLQKNCYTKSVLNAEFQGESEFAIHMYSI